MATFTAINCKRQGGGAMRGTLDYVSQKKKTLWGDAQLVVGHNCVPQSAYTEMLTTKQQFRKTDGRQFYHFVQSFAEDDPITPAEANAIGLELAQREFPGFEVVIATHVDTSHIHNHLVVNSVSYVDGKKLHQSADDLLAHRQANDEICLAHGLSILERPEKQSKMKRMKPGEYQAGRYADSWKLDLIQTINDVLEYARTPDEFIEEHEAFGRGKLLISFQFDKSVCNNQISLLLQNVSVWLLMRSGAFFARSHQPNKAVVNFNVLVSLTVYDGSFSNFNAVNQFLNDFPVQFLQVQILPDGSGPLVDIGDVLLGFPFPG